jgi:hypothetical protein
LFRIGGLLGLLCGGLSRSRRLLRLLELRVTIGELLLQRVNLAVIGLLLLTQFLDLRLH